MKKAYSLTLTIRSESGRCEISMGIDDMTALERKFLFDTIRRTKDVGFGMAETGPGEKTINLTLKEPIPVDIAVDAALRQDLISH